MRAYTTYQDTKVYHNLHTASVITVTGMYINDDVYHREEGDQKGAIARFVSLTGRVFLVSPDSSWVILSSDMKETACGDIQGHTDDKECTLEAGVAKLSYVIPGFRTWFCKSNKERKGAPLITIGGDWAKLQRRRANRRSALRAVTPESPGVMPKEENIAPASSDVLPFTHEPVPFQEEQLCTSSPEELKEELTTEELMTEELTTEELMTGSTIQLEEHIPLASDIATDSEEELRTGDSRSDDDDIQDLLGEIDLITRDDAEGTYSPEPRGDEDSYLTGPSWNLTSNTTIWDGLRKNVVTSVGTDSGDLAGLLPTRPGGGPGCGSITVGMLDKFKEETQFFPFTSTEPSDIEEEPSDVPHLAESFLVTLPEPLLQEEQLLLADPILPASQEEQPGITSHDFKSMEKTESGATGTLAQEELCAPTRTPDDSNIENYNNYHCSIVSDMTIDADVDEGEVDEDPPTRSKYDQINKDESITIMEVIAGTDVKKKDDTVIVATEGDTHGKIIGYNCGDYSDCDYWDEYDIRDENMEIESGTRLPSASYLSPCKALLRAGDFVFTGQPPGG